MRTRWFHVFSRWRLALLAALLLAAGGQADAATPRRDPAKEQSEAYVALIQAEQALKEESYARAILLFRDALDRYNRLAAQFPDWESDIVQYRLASCANQIGVIVQKTGRTEVDWLTAETRQDASLDDKLRARHGALLEENRYLRQRLRDLEENSPQEEDEAEDFRAENERLKAELEQLTGWVGSNTTARTDKMEQERTACLQKVELLEKSLAEASKKEGELAGQVRQAEAELDAVRTQAEKSSREILKKSKAQQKEHQAALQKLEESLQAQTALATELEKERQELAAEGERLKEANREAAQSAIQQALLAEERRSLLEKQAAELEPVQRENAELKKALALALQAEPKMAAPKPDRVPESLGRPLSAEEVEAMIKRGIALEQQGDFSGAQALYDQVLAERPNYVEGLKGRGRCLLQAGHSTEALGTLRESVRLAPSDVQAQWLLGMAYCRLQQFQPALEILRPLVAQDPAHWMARNTLGAALLGAGLFPEARQELERVVKESPRLSDAHYNLAQVYVFSRPPDMEKARQHYRKALELGALPDRDLEQLLRMP